MKNTKKKKPANKAMCMCPYCEEELIIAHLPYCEPCAVIKHCVTCQITVLDKNVTKCPKCGRPLSKGGIKK